MDRSGGAERTRPLRGKDQGHTDEMTEFVGFMGFVGETRPWSCCPTWLARSVGQLEFGRPDRLGPNILLGCS